jgi:hypothetical protein
MSFFLKKPDRPESPRARIRPSSDLDFVACFLSGLFKAGPTKPETGRAARFDSSTKWYTVRDSGLLFLTNFLNEVLCYLHNLCGIVNSYKIWVQIKNYKSKLLISLISTIWNIGSHLIVVMQLKISSLKFSIQDILHDYYISNIGYHILLTNDFYNVM